MPPLHYQIRQHLLLPLLVLGVTINSSGINATGVVTATSFDGSLSSSDLDNSSVNYGGVTLELGGSDATPAFNLSDATAYPYTSLTGITTEIVGDTTPQLGGNLDFNSKFITGTGGINVSGVVTATSFSGSWSKSNGTYWCLLPQLMVMHLMLLRL